MVTQFSIESSLVVVLLTRTFDASQVPPVGLVLTDELVRKTIHSGGQCWPDLVAASGLPKNLDET
jgi:hypothetical protein